MEKYLKSKILVVDDEPANIFLLNGVLTEEGYEVITAKNGEEALDIIFNGPPDTVLLDIMMPGMTGIDVLEKIIADDKVKDIPIIMVTAKVDAEDVEEALDKGAVEYIKKPIDEIELLARLRTVLRLKHQEDALKNALNKLDKINKIIATQKDVIEEEKKMTELLLQSIFPQQAAREFKEKGEVTPRFYNKASVMYIDFKNFNEISSSCNPSILITELHSYFSGFDEIIAKHNLEKIKTVGDVYMCMGGIPVVNESNPVEMTLAALEIKNFINKMANLKKQYNQPFFEFRLGIHTGSVVAGAVGDKKVTYDIWGDSVDIAYKIKTDGEAGSVNISESTYNDIKEYFECNDKAKIEISENKDMALYTVKGLKKEYSEDENGTFPNAEFKKILSRI